MGFGEAGGGSNGEVEAVPVLDEAAEDAGEVLLRTAHLARQAPQQLDEDGDAHPTSSWYAERCAAADAVQVARVARARASAPSSARRSIASTRPRPMSATS